MMILKNFKKILFENIGIRQTIFKNTFWLIFAEIFSRFLEFVLIIYITRILGVFEFGKFTFVLAFVSMFAILSDFGLSDITTREISGDKETEKEYPAVLSLKVILSIGTFVLIMLASFFVTNDPLIRLIIGILAIFILFNYFFFIIYAFLRARQKMEYEAGAKIIRSLIMFVIVFFVLFKAPSVKNISYGYLFANSLALILVLLFFHFQIQSLKLSLRINIWKKFFRISWPLGLAAIFGAIFVNIDSVIMGYLGQLISNGWYNAARKIVAIIIIPTTLIFLSFFPVLSKLFKESKEKFQKVWNYYMALMIILAAPLTTGGLILAPQIINFIYGSGFNPSILVFQILIFMAGISFIYNPYVSILIVSGQQKKYLWVHLIGALTNITLNLILIPRYSLYGAAISAVITYIILIFLTIEFSRRFTFILPFNWQLFKILIIVVLSSTIMAAIISQLLIYNINILCLIIIGILIFFFILFLFYKVFQRFGFLSNRRYIDYFE